MSTYYCFTCDFCKLNGGFYSRQAWGSGNADLVDTYKFVMYHGLNCGTDKIRFLSEHQDDYTDRPDTNNAGEERIKHLKDTKNIFPHSNDWQFMADNKEGYDEKWIKNELDIMELNQ